MLFPMHFSQRYIPFPALPAYRRNNMVENTQAAVGGAVAGAVKQAQSAAAQAAAQAAAKEVEKQFSNAFSSLGNRKR